jgi:hypothetical protein
LGAAILILAERRFAIGFGHSDRAKPAASRRWSLDILRGGLGPALEPTLNPLAGLAALKD